MCRNQNLTGLPKNRHNKLNKSPCTIFDTSNMKNPPKGTTVDIKKLQPGELIHMDFYFYNVTSVYVFTSMLTVAWAKNRKLWIFTTASKQAPIRIIQFILRTLKNEQHSHKICES